MTLANSNTPIPVDDGFNEYESALKRQKSTTSKVWDEMTKLECENKNELKAQCNHCKTIFSAKSSSETSHLRRHLNSCLKKVNKDITQYTIATQPSLRGVPSIKNYKFDADECRQAISTFLVYVKAGLELADDVFDFVETILSNLRLLFDEYVKKSKSTSSSLGGSSNVSDKNPVDSSLDEHNINSADFGGDFDESDDYKQYLNESSTRSEKSQLDIYLEEAKLELNSQIDVLDYWSKSSVRYNELSLLARDLLAIPISTVAFESAFSMGKKVITPLRSSLKPKTVQAVVCLDDWMQAKGFSIEIGCNNDDDDEDDVSSIAF
ncbi:zinc finger BED domain-containing protein RICESLEEPER 1-like [Gossypium raimondii]|uniref:zinc finger BED domain-containing protein RICESLEEPER 1-like n=1 Tax=Gossypium raimondii TaxID=29730 RepID=UPI00227CCA6A|nr:zinc finger BED domain-containing protein RICESLEEPER 1-like [Gossypium raimondii]